MTPTFCYANNVLKQVIGQVAEHYPCLVIDNEAGLENLSRRIVQRPDLLMMVADPSRRGLETLARLHDLAQEMDVRYGRLALVVNRLRGELPEEARRLRERARADFLIALPEAAAVAEIGESGSPVGQLDSGHPLVAALDRFLAEARAS